MEVHDETFGILESAVQLAVADDFRLPSQHSRTGGEHVDYGILQEVLELDAGGRATGYFKGFPDKTAKIELNGKRPTFYTDHWIGGKSGQKAYVFFGELTGHANASGMYQWSQYWMVAEGKYRGKSFKEVHAAQCKNG